MRDRFVPPSYHRELRKKLQRLDQGDKSVQEYYGELQKGLQRCMIVEETEDSIVRFYSGLRCDIQDFLIIRSLSLLCLQRRNCRDARSKIGAAVAAAGRPTLHAYA